MSGFQVFAVETEGQSVRSNRNLGFEEKERFLPYNPPPMVEVRQIETGPSKNQPDSKEREIANLRSSVQSLNNQINDYLRELEQWKQKYKQLQAEKPALASGFISNTAPSNDKELFQLREENRQLKQQLSAVNLSSQRSGGNDWELAQLREEVKTLRAQGTSSSTQSWETQRLQNEIAHLKAALAKASTDPLQQQQVLKLQAENQELKKQVDQLSQQVKASYQEIEGLNFKIEEYIQEITQQQNRIMLLNSNNELEAYLKRISALQHEVIQWKDRCKGLEAQYSGDYYTKIIKEKEQYISSLEMKLRQFEDSNNKFKYQLDTRGTTDRQYEQEINQYKQKIAEMEQDIQVLISDLQGRDSLQQRLSTVQTDFEAKQHAYQLQIENLESRLHQYESQGFQGRELEEQHSRIQREYQALQENYYRAQQELRQAQEQISRYRSEFERVQNEYLVFQRESETKYSSFGSQNNQRVIELENEVRQLRDQMSRQRMEKDRETSNSQFIKLEQQQLQDANSRMQREIRQLQEQLSKQRGEYETLNQNYLTFQRESETYKMGNRETEMLKQKVVQLEYELDFKQRKVEQLQLEIKSAEKSVQDRLEQQFIERLNQYQSTIVSKQSSEGEGLRRQIQDLERQLQSEQQQRNQLRIQMESYRMDQPNVEMLRQQLREYEVKNQQLQQTLTIEAQKYLSEIERLKQDRITTYQQETDHLRRQISEYEYKYKQLHQQYEQDVSRYRSEILSIQNQQKVRTQEVIIKESQVGGEQLKRLQVTIQELESKLSQANMEIERLRNIKKESDGKIQILIEKVTEYESRLNILQQENMRLEQKMKKSVFVEKQGIPSQVYSVEKIVSAGEQPRVERNVYGFQQITTSTLTDYKVGEQKDRMVPTETVTRLASDYMNDPRTRTGEQFFTKRSNFLNEETHGTLRPGSQGKSQIETKQVASYYPSYVSPDRLQASSYNRPPTVQQSNTGGKYQSTKSVKQAIMSKQ